MIAKFRQWLRRETLVLPTVVTLFVLTIYPMLYMLWISVHEWPMIATLPRRFVGLGQYLYVLSNSSFWNSVSVSLTFLVMSVAIQTSIGLALALILNQITVGASVIRLLFMLPLFISPVVAALIWKFMLGYDLGVLNYLLAVIRVPPVNWLGNGTMAFLSLVMVDVWQWTPFSVLILLAGLTSLPSEPYEAAQIDGASSWQSFRFITLPMLLPVLAVVVLFRAVDAFKMFDLAFVLTRGGPGEATNPLALEVWRKGFFQNQLGAAAAISTLMVVMALGLVRVLAKVVKA